MWKLESLGEQYAVYCLSIWHRSRHCYLARNSLLNCSALECQESNQNWAKQKEIVPQHLLLTDFPVLCVGIKVLEICFHWSGLGLGFCLRHILCFCADKYCSTTKIKADYLCILLYDPKYLSSGKHLFTRVWTRITRPKLAWVALWGVLMIANFWSCYPGFQGCCMFWSASRDCLLSCYHGARFGFSF